MKRCIFSFVVLVAASATLFSSCKKEDDDVPVQTCRIATVDRIAGSDTARLHSIAYNSDGKISTVTSVDGSTITFTYAGNSIYIDNQRARRRDTVVVSSNGLIAELRSAYTDRQYTHHVTNQYDGTELRQSALVIVDSGAVRIDTTNYTWIGGNMVREESSGGGFTREFTYHTDKLNPASGGDYIEFSDIVSFGATFIRNRNLVNTIAVNGNIINTFAPVLNTDGTIARILATLGPTSQQTYRYGYACE